MRCWLRNGGTLTGGGTVPTGLVNERRRHATRVVRGRAAALTRTTPTQSCGLDLGHLSAQPLTTRTTLPTCSPWPGPHTFALIRALCLPSPHPAAPH